MTLVVVDSSGEGSGQRIDTSVDTAQENEDSTVIALADVADRSLLRVTDAEQAAAEAADPTTTPGDQITGSAATEQADEAASGPLTITVGDSTPQSAATAGQPTKAESPATATGAARTPAAAGQTAPATKPSQGAATTQAPVPATTRPPTTAAPTTAAPPTAAPTTAAPTTAAPTTAAPAATNTNQGSGGSFESIRNKNPLFNRYANVPSNQLSLDALTIPASPPDNGAHPDGNFRMACEYSHFSYDDPIVFPGQPGKSHLHMFFGNTQVNAHTTTNSLVNSGGGSCNGFELNRSGYWTPAMMDGKGNIVVPDQIILYYKTKHPSETVAMPQGLKMIAGNPLNESFTADQRLGWSCGDSGTSYNKSNRIPNNCGSDPVNAYIQFPFCWDGKNLDSANHMSHMAYVNDNQSCPGSHPVRLPQITILMYFPAGNTSGWYLSSDRSGSFNTGGGATLHADWFGGWNEPAMNLWIDGCIRASRNCSYGQTGTSRMFAKLNNLQAYAGNNVLPMP